MKFTAKTKWIAYGVAGLLTLAAMVWVDRRGEVDTVVAPTRTAVPVRGAAASGDTGAAPANSASADLGALRPRVAAAPSADPFEVNDAAPPPVPMAVASAPVVVALAPQAPPLPFAYIGRWIENGHTVVFLKRDGNSVVVKGPGKLDAQYAVQTIGERQIVMKYLPLGTVQSLSFDAPSPPPAAADPNPAPPTPSSEDVNEPQPGN